MKTVVFVASLVAALALVPATSARAQCRGGGGAGGGTTTSTAGTTGTTTGTGSALASGQLLTGPGSWYHDVMMEQQMQRAVAQYQYAMAVQTAKIKEARLAQRRANADKHRQEALVKRELARARRSNALASN